jgi:hypothetical protein
MSGSSSTSGGSGKTAWCSSTRRPVKRDKWIAVDLFPVQQHHGIGANISSCWPNILLQFKRRIPAARVSVSDFPTCDGYESWNEPTK